MSTHSLHTQGLGLAFGAFRAVHDVTLALEPGARQALIGPNGAGKTTLINLLTGVLRPSAGTIRMGGQDITALSCDRRARMGLARTFQINTLFPSLTPLLSVVLAISERDGLGATWWRPLKRHTKVFDEAHALLGRLKLDALAEVPVSELAYGKQRLLEIALALAARPRILLLDEPAAGVPEDESGELFEAIAALPSRHEPRLPLFAPHLGAGGRPDPHRGHAGRDRCRPARARGLPGQEARGGGAWLSRHSSPSTRSPPATATRWCWTA